VHTDAEVHIANDFGAVVSPKVVLGYFIFQFFFSYVLIFHVLPVFAGCGMMVGLRWFPEFESSVLDASLSPPLHQHRASLRNGCQCNNLATNSTPQLPYYYWLAFSLLQAGTNNKCRPG
jgi:hypothetical protein